MFRADRSASDSLPGPEGQEISTRGEGRSAPASQRVRIAERRPSVPPLSGVSAYSVLSALPAALLLIEAEGHIVFVNERAAAVFGEPAGALQGQNLKAIVPDLDPITSAMVGGGSRTESEISRRDGRVITIGYTLARVPTGGRSLYSFVFQDISRVKELQVERDRLLRIAAIGEALPSLLHELKNPLAAVTATVELLLEDATASSCDSREPLHAVLSEVRRMRLGFDGLSAIDRPLRSNRDAAVDHACRESCLIMASRTRNAGIRFRFNIREMPLLPLDTGVMRALIYNLVTNAVHACERGDTIKLDAWFDQEHGRFEMRVTDTGSGMTPDVLERITELFYTTKKSGSGIGLAICQRAVHGAGGEIRFASVPQAGTSVEISVPVTIDR
ncbi:MAG: ATP-binding protein [Myxococcales bacterium]|nr:ATP-binding protein [Myxococcales bacterium]